MSATTEELAAVLVQIEVAEELAAHAGHALAEAEEADPPDARAVERCRVGLAAAEARLAELRLRRLDLEQRLDPLELVRVHAGRLGR
jgi:hypothetical protein